MLPDRENKQRENHNNYLLYDFFTQKFEHFFFHTRAMNQLFKLEDILKTPQTECFQIFEMRFFSKLQTLHGYCTGVFCFIKNSNFQKMKTFS